MRDAECTAFLQWALPRLDMHWPGFRKVRRQVCKRVRRRIDALGLSGFAAYRERLESDAQEWRVLDQFCHVTISRFFRDRGVFDSLRTTILPAIAERARSEGRDARCWSAGCASGEEPYSMRILWDIGPGCGGSNTKLSIVATDIDDALLARAREGCYDRTSLREIPPELISHAFEQAGSRFRIREQHRESVMFLKQDLRSEAPPGPFDVIICRYLAFTYFAPSLRQKVLDMIAERLLPDGFLMVGSHERLADARFISAAGMPHVFTNVSRAAPMVRPL
jgi:chemotaxis protein methyltransferase CheR